MQSILHGPLILGILIEVGVVQWFVQILPFSNLHLLFGPIKLLEPLPKIDIGIGDELILIVLIAKLDELTEYGTQLVEFHHDFSVAVVWDFVPCPTDYRNEGGVLLDHGVYVEVVIAVDEVFGVVGELVRL